MYQGWKRPRRGAFERGLQQVVEAGIREGGQAPVHGIHDGFDDLGRGPRGHDAVAQGEGGLELPGGHEPAHLLDQELQRFEPRGARRRSQGLRRGAVAFIERHYIPCGRPRNESSP